IKKILILSALLIGVFGLMGVIFFGLISPRYEDGYNASLIDKTARLKSINEPKIILVGDSNLVFGIDSALMEEELGMPVVNMGLHGGLGWAFSMEAARQNINEGDIVVLSQVGYSDDDTIPDPALAWITLENHLDLWPILRARDWPLMLQALPTYALKTINFAITDPEGSIASGAYARSEFNKYGDNVFERDSLPGFDFYDSSVTLTIPKVNDINIDRINEFKKYCDEKGATLLVTLYPVAMGDVSPSEAEYEAFEEELKTMTEAPVISEFSDYYFGYDCFFDTKYHLKNEAAKVRTRSLIRDLENYMSGE
ncbi:MAG: hypothetical protein HUJ75_08435, partial [Parasporobacterium sp.]|nr:hypothetical protein [Parasporobacterium sp.]